MNVFVWLKNKSEKPVPQFSSKPSAQIPTELLLSQFQALSEAFNQSNGTQDDLLRSDPERCSLANNVSYLTFCSDGKPQKVEVNGTAWFRRGLVARLQVNIHSELPSSRQGYACEFRNNPRRGIWAREMGTSDDSAGFRKWQRIDVEAHPSTKN